MYCFSRRLPRAGKQELIHLSSLEALLLIRGFAVLLKSVAIRRKFGFEFRLLGYALITGLWLPPLDRLWSPLEGHIVA
jgi:hypothetical protein